MELIRKITKKHQNLLGYFDNIQELLNKIPNIDYKKSTFPNTLRIIGKMNCLSYCLLGSKQNNLCHGEGLFHCNDTNIANFAPLEDILSICEPIDPASIKVIGIDNSNINEACKIISAFHDAGFNDISTTCANFSLVEQMSPLLKNAGLSRITLSLHKFLKDDKTNVERVIYKLQELNLYPIKINRVLLSSQINDLEGMINWAQEKNLTLRLFSLIKTANNGNLFTKEFVHWTSQLPLFIKQIKLLECEEFSISNRIRLKMRLIGGGVIEANLPMIQFPNAFVVIPECRTCNMKSACEEGYLGCGIRFGPDSKVYPCLHRPELSFNFRGRNL